MKTPAAVYRRSARSYRGVRVPRYRAGLALRKVDSAGHVRLESHSLFVGGGFAGYRVGLERLGEESVRLWFYELDLGVVDLAGTSATDSATSGGREPRAKAKMT